MILTHKEYPYKFDSKRCESCEGDCCIGEPGYIWIKKEEQKKLASYLKISLLDLRSKYLKKVDYKYSIKENKIDNQNYACIFFDLDKKQCSIYDVRPSQCISFPFWDYFKNKVNEVKEECPAVID